MTLFVHTITFYSIYILWRVTIWHDYHGNNLIRFNGWHNSHKLYSIFLPPKIHIYKKMYLHIMRPPTNKDKENRHMLLFSTKVVIYSCRMYMENCKIQTKIMMNTIKNGCFSFKFKRKTISKPNKFK